jgi:hypothetical protein
LGCFCITARVCREAALMAQHPENEAIDDWIEVAYDWGRLKVTTSHPRVLPRDRD